LTDNATRDKLTAIKESIMKQIRIYRNGQFYLSKPGKTLADLKADGYFDRHPDAIICKAMPGVQTLNKWAEDGIAKALDGCKVEPDGHCQHGAPSWLLALGYI
jgi:hypothetical protein